MTLMETAMALLVGITIIALIIAGWDIWSRRNLSGSLEVRRAAAKALGKLKAQEAVEALIQALQSDPDTNVRRAAAEALGQIGDKQAVEPLISLWS